VTLNARGRRAVRAPQNRLLRLLATAGPLGLHTLMADAGVDTQAVSSLGHRALVAAAVAATGAPLTPDDLGLLPAPTVTVRLTDKGRTYLPRAARQALPTQRGPASTVPASTTPAVFAEDSEIDIGPGGLFPRGFNGPSVEWSDGHGTSGRVLRITDLDTDQDARITLSAEQIRALRDELGGALAVRAAGGLVAGDGAITWQPGPDGRYQVQLAGEDDEQAVLSLTPAQMRAWHDQLGADLAAEDTARATFPGLTGRLQDRVRGQQLDLDSPLTLDTGGLTSEQMAASARVLRFYRGGSYRAIAAHLRGDADPDETFLVRERPGEPGLEERLAEHVDAIDQALAAAPLAEPVIVWRGVRELADHIGADLGADPVGTSWVERSFPSTSVDPNVASIFAEDVLLRLHIPAGVGAIQLDSRPTDRENTREAEILLPRGLQMRVTGESEVPIGGGGTTFRDGKMHVVPPTPYRVLEVEVSMPAPPKRRRTAGRPPAQPVASDDGDQVDVGPAAAVTAAEPVSPPAGPLTRSPESIRLPNNGQDQGLMHFDSALGMLWQDLGDDRHLQVDGHALGNLITDLGEGITWRHHDSNHALAELRRLRAQMPEGQAARLIDVAVQRLDAPPRPAPTLPEQAPEQLHTLMADLNAINLVRRGYDAGTGEPFHETDKLADLTAQLLAGKLRGMRFEQELHNLARLRHESQEGYTEIHAAVNRALVDSRQWLRRRPTAKENS
jgi:ADP-ribosyltransferase exoenzyme